jgi:hypothetical protein
MIVVRVEDEPLPATDEVYLSPFLKLAVEASQQFKISEQNPSTKKELVNHFLKQTVDGKLISPNIAGQLATLIRPPAAMKGGKKKKG